MKILLLESFYTSSHKQWVDGLIANSNHDIQFLSLPGRHWKWRMHHAGQYFAMEIIKLTTSYDVILCSDLMNVAEFRGVLHTFGGSKSWFNNVPIITYFHENQITYPWSDEDPDVTLKRDNHYGWINYVSCLCSDRIVFNSVFHQSNFLNSLPLFLNQFPKGIQDDQLNKIKKSSFVLPVGLHLKPLIKLEKKTNEKPIILWNHRWEYDKNPTLFFESLFELNHEGYDFELIIAGEKYKNYPQIFDRAKNELKDKIIHVGFAKSREQYLELLQKSDILPVTSNQDFFGISVIEAIAAGCQPILPDRLAFPEHLEGVNFKKYYFTSPHEFNTKLKNSIEIHTNKDTSLRNHVLKYDWSIVAPEYDKLFENAHKNI
ncbi:MAG: DUF3524 domain-containing protein [Saprospiraceae bacterium]|nr:DUF3524 domain-containing protein [Saprospiraceae bacterium]